MSRDKVPRILLLQVIPVKEVKLRFMIASYCIEFMIYKETNTSDAYILEECKAFLIIFKIL